MGLVCSGKCGQDTVGPEPNTHTPTRHRHKTAQHQGTQRKDITVENSDRSSRSECENRSESCRHPCDQQRQGSEEQAGEMPTRTLLVEESRHPGSAHDADLYRNPSPGVGALSLQVNGRNKMNHLDHSATQEVTGEAVGQYLKAHPEFLETWLMEQVELETLERWMIRRTQRDKQKSLENGTNGKIIRKTSLSRWKFCVHADKRKMLQELTSSLHLRPNKPNVLWELAHCISSAVNAEGCNLYLADPAANTLHKHLPTKDGVEVSSTGSWSCEIGTGSWLCAWVASTRQVVRVTSPMNDPRFPRGCPFAEEEVHHALAMAVVQNDGELAAVLEFFRRQSGETFHEEDEEIVNSYLVWGGIAIHYAELYHSMVKQRKLNEFILSVVKSIFQDMVSMDTLIMKVMNFAQKLVNADRASLFLVDAKNRQLYARIFDMGSEFDEDSPPQAFKEIRFPIGTGIAGIVALKGEVLNIPDAYADPRFNRTVDQLTGYVTKSILCMPIFIRGNVIGVMQMVNKAAGVFSKEDEESFEMFAVYCGLALHHAKLYDKIRRSEQKYKVALEMMSYHSSCGQEELDRLSREEVPSHLADVDK